MSDQLVNCATCFSSTEKIQTEKKGWIFEKGIWVCRRCQECSDQNPCYLCFVCFPE